MNHSRFLFLSLWLLFLGTGCNRITSIPTLSECNSTFAEIYQLKDIHPDSAFQVFNSIADTLDEVHLRHQSEFLFFEYQVLKAELSYKNYSRAQNDSLVVAASYFYDSLVSGSRKMRNDPFLVLQQARAVYYKAVTEGRHNDTFVEAFSDYLKALWIMDGLTKERRVFISGIYNKEYEHFTGLIYDRLAWFLYNHDAWEPAMECLELSSECFEKEGVQEGIASNYDLMGDIMLAQENRNMAVVYYKESDSIYKQLQRDNLYRGFNYELHRGITLSSEGRKDEAIKVLSHALEKAQSPWMARRLHFGLGYIYYDLQEYDSSLYHYEQSYPLLPRQTAKSYVRIVKLANIVGDSTKAARYGELLSDYYVDQAQQGHLKTRMVLLYESFKSETKEARNKNIFLFILSILVMLAVVIVVDTVFIHWYRRKRRNEIEHHERIKASLEDKIELARNDSLRKDDKIKALQDELEKKLSAPDFYKLPFDDRMEVLLQMPICKRVLLVKDTNVKAGAAYPELVLSENQKTSLVNAVDSVFPKFSVKIIEDYPRLKRSDVIYCCMYVLGVTEVQAAALTGKTYQAVWTRSLKLHEIFDNKSDLQFILRNILINWK